MYGFTYSNSIPGDHTDYWGNRCYSNAAADLGNFNIYFDYLGIDTTALKSWLEGHGNLAQFIGNQPGDQYYYHKLKLQSTLYGDTRQPTSPQFHGVLTSIIYPNGGVTTFNWENHRFPTATAANGDFVFDRRRQRIIEGGGFRIESITNCAVDGTVSTDYYRYGFTVGDIIHRNFPLPLSDSLNLNDTINHHIGCGEAIVDPNLLTFMNYSYALCFSLDFKKMVIGLPVNFTNILQMYNTENRANWWDAYFSANTFRSLLGGRRPVVYPEITVYHGHPYELNECRSKTVYKYDIYAKHDSSTYYMSSFNQTSMPDTAYFEPLYYYNNGSNNYSGPGMRCIEFPGKRHQLKSKSDYSFNASSATWELVSEEDYSYSEEKKSKEGNILDSDISRGHCGRHTLQAGAGRPLESFTLREFYKPSSQCFGRSTMTGKNITTLRQGGTRTIDNTKYETFSYLYQEVLKSREHSDLPHNIRYDYGVDNCDKNDVYTYIGELNDNSNPVIAEMKSRNMLASLVSSETFTLVPDSFMITGSKIDYGFFGNSILPSMLYESNGNHYEQSIEIISYGAGGNPTEIEDKKTGVHSVFIWSSYGRYLAAMIKNATLTEIENISQLTAMPSWARYATLKALLPDAQIQTWDYIPLIGVSSHTDVNGKTVLYEYDGLGRLKAEKRLVNGISDPEILHKYEYNYVNQE